MTEALAAILAWPQEGRAALVAEVVRGCEVVAAGGGPYAAACAAAIRVNAEHPGDIGLIASLLIRHSVLEPGQAVFLPAGGLHAYMQGTGVELIANSDNVVRAGLTPKHIDVPELLKLTDPAVEVPVLEPRPLGGGLFVFDTPAPEFRLYRAELGDGEITLPGDGRPPDRALHRGRGRASGRRPGRDRPTSPWAGASRASSPPTDGAVTAAGPATVFIAASGLRPLAQA